MQLILKKNTKCVCLYKTGGGGKNGKSRGPGGWPVEGCLFWFLCSAQKCFPPHSFFVGCFWRGEISFSLRWNIWVCCACFIVGLGGNVLNE